MVQVSVCIITYNHARFIEQAIKSALEQDVNFEYEIVVGEDCSTDSTASILRELERKNHSRIRVIYRPKNLGGKANLLNTLSVCNGEYVAFLEGDDYWASNNKLQRQVDFLNNNRGAVGVFHRTRVINGELGELTERVYPAVDPTEFFSLDFLCRNNRWANQFCVSSLLARRACLRNIETWLASGRPGDWPLYVMLATQGDLGFIPFEMSHYRSHAAGSWQRLSRPHQVALIVRMLMHVMELVSGKNQELVESIKSLHAHWWTELVADPSVSIEAVTNELNEIGDFQLSNYLLAQVVTVSRVRAVEAEAALRANPQFAQANAEPDQRVSTLEAQVLALTSSSSWRLTEPLRRLAGKGSHRTRRNLGRVAKATWWVMTPWRIPARIRLLRERNVASKLASTMAAETVGARIGVCSGKIPRGAKASDSPVVTSR